MSQRRTLRQGPLSSIGFVFLIVSLVMAATWHPLPATAQDVPTGASGLTSTLALVPATLPELDDPDGAIVSYADIAAQLAAVGVEPPDDVDDDAFMLWTAATLGMSMPGEAASHLNIWRDAFGFDLLQADQTLQVSLPPFELTMYRGRFDEGEIVSALGRLGYEPLDVDGRTILSIRDDFETELSAPTGYVLASMNYAALLDDGTLVFAPARANVESVLEVAAGDAPSLVERDDVAALLPHVSDEVVSALLVSGLMLAGGLPASFPDLGEAGTPDIDVIATEVAEQGRMPPIQLALLGTTAGGPLAMRGEAVPESPEIPAAHAVITLLMLSPDGAETAVPIVEERLETGSSAMTGQPFTEFFPERSVRAVPDEPVVVVDLRIGEESSRAILQQLLYSRDLGFLAW